MLSDGWNWEGEERISRCRRFVCRPIPTLETSPQIVMERDSQIATTSIAELSSRFIDIGIATTSDQHDVNNSRWKGP
jgi:hypothetical protein